MLDSPIGSQVQIILIFTVRNSVCQERNPQYISSVYHEKLKCVQYYFLQGILCVNLVSGQICEDYVKTVVF